MKIHTFGFYKQAGGVVPPFADGSDGSLIILNGETVNLVAPVVKQYTNVDIQSGGTLNILGDGDLAELICTGTVNISGTIVTRATERNGYTYSGTTTSGIPYSHTAIQKLGGTGGAGGNSNSGNGPSNSGAGGAGTNGYGGGGGGGGSSTTANTSFIGGAGGSNNGSGSNGTGDRRGAGGAGNSTNGNGGNGAILNNSGNDAFGTSGGSGGGSGGGGGGGGTGTGKIVFLYGGTGGGGGGHKGLHGGILSIYSVQPITGTGSILVSGSGGFNGGAGGNVQTVFVNGGGGGGGGGAGGSGGKLILQAPSYTPTVDVSGGSGGSGGARGTVGDGSALPANQGIVGGSGQTGNAGALEVI